MYRPITLVLLVIVPREPLRAVDDDGPVFISTFVVCDLNSIHICSSGVAGRANGQVNSYK